MTEPTKTTEQYAELWLRGLAAVLEALVFMALSIPVAFGLPLVISQIDARFVLPEMPAYFFMEGFAPGVVSPFFFMSLKKHMEAAAMAGPTESTTMILALTMGGLVLTNLLYHVIMESSPLQGTIGKIVVGMKVTNSTGDRPSLSAALIRHLTRLLSMMPLFAGYLMVLKSARKQALHDKLSGCLVVTTPANPN